MPSLPVVTSVLLTLVSKPLFRSREAKVVTARSNGLENLAAENIVALILGEIEFCGKETGQ